MNLCPVLGAHDGRIIRTRPSVDGKLTPLETIVYTGNPSLADREHPCGSHESEAICGRPLGMAFNDEGELIVADCYIGLISVNVTAKTKHLLLDRVDDVRVYFANSVVVGPKSGRIYLTDSSQRFRRRDFLYEVIESSTTGRVIVYDPKTKESKVLADEIAFSNGILVDPTESFLLVNELNRAQIVRFDLTKFDFDSGAVIHWNQRRDVDDHAASVFIDNLPGFPDNLAWASKDNGALTLWVGLGSKRTTPFSFIDSVSSYPKVRNFLVSLLPKTAFLKFVAKIGLVARIRVHSGATLFNPKGYTMGTIMETLQDPTGGIHLITGAYEENGYLYLGSISDEINFLPRIPWTQKNATDESWRFKE